MEMGARATTARRGASLLAVIALGALLFGMSTAQAAVQQSTPQSTITITQTPSGTTTPFCLPPFLALRHSVGGDAQTFSLRIEVTAPLCSRIDAVAVIYAMPGNGVAWPQTYVTSKGFSLQQPGVTEVVFTKGCDPVQFDVVTGPTPPTISPDGVWHGPLLFPLDLNTSQQWWGCGPDPTTTTSSTTTSTPPTTIPDDCEDYTPTAISASPSVVPPGGSIAVAGTGTPGTTIQAVLRQGGAVAALSDPALVAPDGSWSTSLLVPPDAAPGTWTVAAYAAACDTEVTTEVTVDDGPDGPPTPPPTEPPVVAGEVVVNELPPQAVVLSSSDARDGRGAAAAGLAFTGVGARLPVIIAVGLIAAGGLLLLRSRQRS